MLGISKTNSWTSFYTTKKSSTVCKLSMDRVKNEADIGAMIPGWGTVRYVLSNPWLITRMYDGNIETSTNLRLVHACISTCVYQNWSRNRPRYVHTPKQTKTWARAHAILHVFNLKYYRLFRGCKCTYLMHLLSLHKFQSSFTTPWYWTSFFAWEFNNPFQKQTCWIWIIDDYISQLFCLFVQVISDSD